ncbi:hypothetical protein, partial [Neisseria gonorrhoeae]
CCRLQVMCLKMPSEFFQTAFLPTRFACRVGLPVRPEASDKQGGFYSGLNLNRYGVASPCRTICTVCGFAALS